MASFFYCGRLSSTQLVPLQAPKHRPIISPHPVEQTAVPERHQRQWIINPSLQICACNFNTKEWTHSLTAVPFVRVAPKRVPSDSEKHRRVYTSSNICHSHEWRADTFSGKTLKKRNACSDVRRLAVQNRIPGLNGLRSEGVNHGVIYLGNAYCNYVYKLLLLLRLLLL